ncbi:MAG: toxin [Spirochaetes bacterium RBG_16_49_21]|nr:MAG: toxin [Spirochaetes bacterium RBG_16_49_21]
MKTYSWDTKKNETLKKLRGISFEEIVYYLSAGHLMDVIDNNKYPDQSIFVIEMNKYIYLVPFKETENQITLITIFKSRKATKKYLKSRK